VSGTETGLSINDFDYSVPSSFISP